MNIPGLRAMPSCRAAVPWLLVAFLFVLPFSASIALRNALLGLALACVLLGSAGGSVRVPPGRLLLPIACWSAWCAATLAWSVDPAYTLSELRPGLLYPFVAFLVFHAATQGPAAIDRWAWPLCAGLAVLGLAAAVPNLATGAWNAERLHGGSGSFSTHVVLALPMLAWAWLRTPPGLVATRGALAATAILALAALWWTDNRIAWAALGAMTALAAILAAALHGPSRQCRRELGAVLLAGVFVALFSFALPARSPSPQKTPIDAAREFSADPRLEIWSHSAAIVAQSPWIGHGYGRAIVRAQIRSRVEPWKNRALYMHGHNTVLNVVLQTGLVGLALFAWMVGAVVREMAAGLRQEAGRRDAAILGLVLVAGFAIRNLTDDFLVRHNALLAWSLAGAVLGALRAPGEPTSARTPG
jgi:O-antigen ligase